jgi:hypothetical protein
MPSMNDVHLGYISDFKINLYHNLNLDMTPYQCQTKYFSD